MRYILSIVIVLILITCGERKQQDETGAEIILQTIDSAINHFSNNMLDSAPFVHWEFKRGLKSKALENEVNVNSLKYRSQELELIQNLLKRAEDSVKFKFKEPFYFNHNVIFEGDGFNPDEVFGLINLSDPAINDERDFGCYYLSIDCPHIDPKCSEGFLIFVEYSKSHWRIKKIKKLWGVTDAKFYPGSAKG